jgi:hypothetical protein
VRKDAEDKAEAKVVKETMKEAPKRRRRRRPRKKSEEGARLGRKAGSENGLVGSDRAGGVFVAGQCRLGEVVGMEKMLVPGVVVGDLPRKYSRHQERNATKSSRELGQIHTCTPIHTYSNHHSNESRRPQSFT